MAIDLDKLPERMKRLEEQAFRDFLLAFGFRLRRLFQHWGVPASDAEELATTCLSEVAVKVEQFSSRGPGSFERWVLKIARTAWIDAWRERDQALPLADLARYEWEQADLEEADPEVVAAVGKALAQLSEVDRSIVRLRHMERELSFAEIAEKVGLKEGAVRVRHHRALQQLETFLRNHPAIRACRSICSPLFQDPSNHE